MRRVVITGQGVAGSAGTDSAAVWRALIEGCPVGAPAGGCADAARAAVAQSGLAFADGIGERSAIILGTLDAAAVGALAREHGITGPAFAVSSACASAGHAMGHAFQLVRAGLAEAALTGGSSGSPDTGSIAAWQAAGLLTADLCRPFARGRSGTRLEAGAALFLFESLESAHARHAEMLAEVIGIGMTTSARAGTPPDEEGAARAIVAALADARIDPGEIDYVAAHGLGTLEGDRAEVRALHQAFGFHARRLAVSSAKPVFGHTLAASAAFGLVAAVGALRHGVVPPTGNHDGADPGCDLDVCPNTARERPLRTALVPAFGLGGLNAVLVVRRL
ncbi:MAG: beta-ketoacyl synthase N-terminal-like domain-containing protein [Rhodospirillaceae bacterium]